MTANCGEIYSFAALRCFACSIVLAMAAGVVHGKSIFDDDYKGDSQPLPKAVEASPPKVERPATPRLKPRTEEQTHSVPVQPQPAAPDARVTSEASPPRIALPEKKAVASSEKLIKTAFAAEYANVTPAGKQTLAKALINEVEHGQNLSGPELSVLLREAYSAAIAGGDPHDAVAAAHGLRDLFNITPAAAKELEHEAILTHPASSSAPLGPAELFEARQTGLFLMGNAERQLNADNYIESAAIASNAENFARRTNDSHLMDRVHARSVVLSSIASAYTIAKPSFDALRESPNDARANAAVGRFYAFTLDKCERGMPMLAKGNDALAKVAIEDDGRPAGIDEQIALADAWMSQSHIGTTAAFKSQLIHRAFYWYDSALAQSGGIPKLMLAKKVDAMRISTLAHGLRADYFRGQKCMMPVSVTRVDPTVEFRWDGIPPEDGIHGDFFAARWTGYIKAPVAGDYTLLLVADDGAKLWLDDELMLNIENGNRRDKKQVRLNGAYQRLRIDYVQWTGAAYCGLGWIPPHSSHATAVSSESLFHQPFEPTPLEPVVASAPEGDPIVLDAQTAEVQSGTINYRSHNDNVQRLADWNDTRWEPAWNFDAKEGEYDVEIRYACDGQAGTSYQVLVGRSVLSDVVQESGGWEVDITKRLGRVHLEAGAQTLKVVAINKPNQAVMEMAGITLKPVKAK